ncbi:MAG: hypothetical protein JKY40_03260, partial [Gammaproteobacteria bacterium]|nr:hypothetical protein [Gammaproteobacteria bacterium]
DNLIAGAGFSDVTLLDDATLNNVDSADYDGGFLNLVQNSGTANGSWGVDGATATAGGDASIVAGETVAVGATSIGTVHASNDGQVGNDLEIAFNASATSAEIQTLLRSLTYSAPSSAGARGFTVTTNDADGTANSGTEEASASFTLNINPTNPPVVSNLGGDSSSVTAAGNLALDKSGNAVVTDPDSADFSAGNLTVTRTTGLSGNFSLTGTAGTGVSSGTAVGVADAVIAAGDSIFVDGLEIGTVTTNGQGTNDLLIAFSASATAANSSTLIQALLYALPAVSTHTFDVTISDGAATSSISAVSVAFVALPPPPPSIPVTPVTPIIDGKVPAFTRLKNVIIGENAVLDPTVKLGAGVTFRGSNIPPGINLTGIFESAPFALQENILCVDLDTIIFEDSSKSLLDSMGELEAFTQDGIKLAQDSLSCELNITSDEFRTKSLPFNVFQAENTENSGVSVNGGITRIINGNRQNIVLYPLVFDAPFLADELEKLDFEFAMNEQAIYVLSETATGNSDARFLVRPDPLAIISNDLQPGLYTYTMESPAGVNGVYLVVEDDDGTILRQELNSVPADWAALSNALEGVSGIENIQLTQKGVIEFSIDGASFRAMMDFKVGNSGPSANDDILFEQLGDMNGDGVDDYLVHFPNGDEQVLYILP